MMDRWIRTYTTQYTHPQELRPTEEETKQYSLIYSNILSGRLHSKPPERERDTVIEDRDRKRRDHRTIRDALEKCTYIIINLTLGS